FILHYASCPIFSFHLPAVAETIFQKSSPKADFVIEQCKLQFRAWSSSLSRILATESQSSGTKPRLTIRFCISDLFNFCGTLASGEISSGRYTNPWDASEL